MGVIQTLKVELDKQSVASILKEVAGLGAAVAEGITGKLDQLKGNEAGAKAAREVVAGLQRGFAADLDALRLKFERGIVRPEAFERKAVQAAQAYNNALKSEVAKIAADPSFSENPFRNVSLKATEDDAKLVGGAFAEGAKTGAHDAAPALSAEIMAGLTASADAAKGLGTRAIENFSAALAAVPLDDEGKKKAAEFAEAMRAGLERGLAGLRQEVLDGVVPAQDFAAKATALAQDFSERLQTGLSRLSAGKLDLSDLTDGAAEAGRAVGEKVLEGAKTGAKGTGTALSGEILAALAKSEGAAREAGIRALRSFDAFMETAAGKNLAPEAAKSAAQAIEAMGSTFTRGLADLRKQVVDGVLPAQEFDARATALAGSLTDRITEGLDRLKAGKLDLSDLTAGLVEDAATVGRTVGERVAEGAKTGAQGTGAALSDSILAGLRESATRAQDVAEGALRSFTAEFEKGGLDEAGTRQAAAFAEAMRTSFATSLGGLRRQVLDGVLPAAEFDARAKTLGEDLATRLSEGISRLKAGKLDLSDLTRAAEAEGQRSGAAYGKGATSAIAHAGPALSAEIQDKVWKSTGRAQEAGAKAIGAFVEQLSKTNLDPAGAKAVGEFVSGMRKGFAADLAALNKEVLDGTLPADQFDARAQAIADDFVSRFTQASERLQAGSVDFSGLTASAAQAGQAAGDELKKGVSNPEISDAARKRGFDAATAFVEAIKSESKRAHDEIRVAQAEGFLTPVEAERRGVEISSRVNHSLLDGLKKFRQRSDFSPQMLGIFTDAFERIGEEIPPRTFFERVKKRIGTQLVTVGASIVGFFAARRIALFGEDAVREFLAEDKALQGLENQIDGTGAAYVRLRPQIEAITKRLSDLGAASEGQTAAGIAQLISVSHDAEKSVRNIGVAADFAAKHNLTFEQATELVGRAMVGQVRELRQYGLVVKNGDDAVLAMAKDSAGFAERQAPQLQRAVARTAFEWANLKSAIGESILAAGGGTSTIDLLTTTLRDGVQWVKAHREEIGRWGAALVNLAAFLAKWVVVPIARGVTLIVESFEDVGLTIDGLWQRLKFIGGGFAIIAAEIRESWADVLDFLGFHNPDEVAAETNRNLRAWGEKVQAEAVRQKTAIDATLAKIRTPPSERPAAAPTGQRAGGPSRFVNPNPAPGGAVHPAGFDVNADPDSKLAKRIELLTKASQIESLRASALLGLSKIEGEIEKVLKRTNIPLERRIALEEHLNVVQRALGTLPLAKLTTGEQLGILEQTIHLESLRAESLTNLARLEAKLTADMNDGTKSIEFRAQAEDDLRKAQDLRGTRPFETLDLDKRIDLLTQATQIESTREAALKDLAAAEVELRQKMLNGNHTREERIAVDAKLLEIEKALGTVQIGDLGLQDQIAVFQAGLDNVATFAESLRGLQAAEARLRKELDASIPGTQKHIELEAQLYNLRTTLGQTSLEGQIELLDKAVQSEETRAQAIRELLRLEKELIRLQKDKLLSGEARDAIGANQSRVAQALAKAPTGDVRAAREEGAQPDGGQDVAVPIVPATDTEGAIRQFKDKLATIGAAMPPVQIPFKDDLIRTFFDNLDTFAHNAAEGIGEVFESTFKNVLGIMDEATKQQVEDLERRRAQVVESMNRKDISAEGREKLQGQLDEIDEKLHMLKGDALSVGEALANLGKGMAKSILKEIAAMAKGKALENVAVAIEETAKGFAALASFNPASASLHFKAAGTAALAAVKWGLVAGGAGALAGSTGGGGGGSGSVGSNRETEKSDIGNRRGTVTFFIKGGLLNTDDHRQMDELARGIRAVTDRDVVIRRG